MSSHKINIADAFALIRIISFPIVLYFILTEQRSLSAWLYLILFSTDALDGFFAKLFNLESSRRAQFDTMGDILFLVVGFIGFYVFQKEFFINQIFLIITVISLYAIELTASLIKFNRPSFFHTYSAKAAAFFQVSFLVVMLFYKPLPWLFYLTVITSIIDALEDLIIVFILKKYETNVKGLYWVLK